MTLAIPVTSRYAQTDEHFLDQVNHRPTKNKKTQTSKLLAIFATNKPKVKSVETQTHYQALASSSTQTDSPESYSYELELHSDELDKQSSSDEEYEPNKEENDKETIGDDGGFELNQQKAADSIILSSNKPPQDQIKFNIFEESIVERFGVCSTCKSTCTVSIQGNIGTYCKIAVHCNADSDHNFTWSTGPLYNRLPVLHVMIASSILCTGMECAKALRLFESLNIQCFKRRELSNLLTCYVIPAVFNVWKREQQSLLNSVKNTPLCITSDMRIDSPGHSGLFGSGSSLDVERNIILDTQVIKVIEASRLCVLSILTLETLKQRSHEIVSVLLSV